jgi:predicted HAD superfamily hydrolase
VLSGNLTPGTTFSISAQGAETGMRGIKDGITYFGCKKRGGKSGIRYRKGEIINDIVIKAKDKEISRRHRGRHFQIQYCLESNCYKIKDLGIGYGAYAKLENPLLLKDNYLLSMGESFFIVNLIPDTGAEKQTSKLTEGKISTHLRLRIKVFSGPANGEILYY